ncbi:uncharacterized protein LOC106168856 [Lingula anatina]|uniref:Uncharacterized protein LOC106168856 n=1 Tax=Lingula anatina TaxID=7574 RepID=A0A1S3J135_LINAN|nr:uncharacterized protein LOC106168856 [Lingula anatina]|eukprot:XP_013403519.1 uncharacterized protein LOC106168856 [Lingula anatina]
MTSWIKLKSVLAVLELFFLAWFTAAWHTLGSELGDQNEAHTGPASRSDIGNATDSPPYYEEQLKIVRSLNGSFIPVPWHFCDVSYPSDESINVSCEIPANGHLSLKKYQSWIKTVNRTNRLKVKCDSGGNISAPWPMKVSGLQALEIEGCNVKDYLRHQAFGDYYSYTGPDVLKVLKIFNSVLYSDFLSLNQTFHRKDGNRETECGSLELHELRMRDIKIGFEPMPKISFQSKENNSTNNSTLKTIKSHSKPKLNGTLRQPQHWCSYNHMEIVEFSNYAYFRVFFITIFVRSHGYPALHTLIAVRNNITVFPQELTATLLNFPKLRYVDLRYNSIKELKIPRGSNRVFDLRHNDIQDLTIENVNAMSGRYAAHVDFRNNPIDCGCNNSDAVKHLRSEVVRNKLDKSTYRFLYDIPCHHGETTTTIRSINLDDLNECFIIRHKSIIPWIVLGLLACLVVLTAILTVYFRREIQILLFTRLKCRCFKSRFSCPPKRFDAFVSYNSGDEHWIVHTLAPKLENQKPPFRLCLHYRDFIVGAAIAENIIESIEASRHTIMVLSENFLKSEWCLMEFRAAYHQGLRERNKHLIAIVLEDILLDDIEADLRSHLRTTTYLKVSDKWFWDKLIYCLSRNPHDEISKKKTKTKLSKTSKEINSNSWNRTRDLKIDDVSTV